MKKLIPNLNIIMFQPKKIENQIQYSIFFYFENWTYVSVSWPSGIQNLAFTWKLLLISELNNPFGLLHLNIPGPNNFWYSCRVQILKFVFYWAKATHLNSRNSLKILLPGNLVTWFPEVSRTRTRNCLRIPFPADLTYSYLIFKLIVRILILEHFYFWFPEASRKPFSGASAWLGLAHNLLNAHAQCNNPLRVVARPTNT